MKKFVFTLQTVYDLAISTEKQQKIRLKQLEDMLAKLHLELNDMKNSYLDAKEDCARKMKTGLSSDKLAQYSAYFERLINSMILQKGKIVRTEEEKERWMQARIKTRKEIITLEKLRDSQYEEYLAEERQEAEKEIGDIVSFRVASNQVR